MHIEVTIPNFKSSEVFERIVLNLISSISDQVEVVTIWQAKIIHGGHPGVYKCRVCLRIDGVEFELEISTTDWRLYEWFVKAPVNELYHRQMAFMILEVITYNLADIHEDIKE